MASVCVARVAGLPVLPLAVEAVGKVHDVAVLLCDPEGGLPLNGSGPGRPPSTNELHLVLLPADGELSRLDRIPEVAENDLREVVIVLQNSSDRSRRGSITCDLLIGDGEEASVIVCDLVEGRHVAIERCPTARVHDLNHVAARAPEALLMAAAVGQAIASPTNLAIAEEPAIHCAVVLGGDVRRLGGDRVQTAHEAVGVLAGAALTLVGHQGVMSLAPHAHRALSDSCRSKRNKGEHQSPHHDGFRFRNAGINES
mmetsp:Transcript_128542/g.181322  ORF Transcript_128542/g.181322 Transcript_128542/m.181322 type:complete len:256 (+) Transcript_128542:503-1270(+)